MKLSLVWCMSLFSAAHPAGAGSDNGDIAEIVQMGWSGRPGSGGPDMPMRRKPRLTLADQDDKTVVIVGAGYAGWGAAHRLVEGGMRAEDITILEADVGFGGRAQKNDDFMPFPLDLGPSFIPTHFKSELAALSGVPEEDLPINNVNGVGLWRDAMTYNEFLSNHIISKLDVCDSELECREQTEKMGFNFEGKTTWGKGCYSKNDKVYWGGKKTGALTGKMKRINCDKVNKEYGCRVTSVDYEGPDHVVTTCESGSSFVSTHVIVTVPLSVLKDGDIKFKPVLSDGIQQNVEERGWLRGFKLFLEFDTDFDPESMFNFGGEYDYDPETKLLTGEHLFWDYTGNSAPDFKGTRNLVSGYWIGTKADEFDGMNKTQIVDKVLKKFKNYYYDGNSYTRGYHPSSYKQHLLVDWENPEVKPFVRGTYSQMSVNFEGHRADNRNKLFLAGEAFPAPLSEFCSSPIYCYFDKWWVDLSEEIQEAFTILGWDREMWNKGVNIPDTEEMLWDELTNKQKEAATVIGFTQESWDKRIVCASPEECYDDKWWSGLPKEIQKAYMVLGYDKDSWNNGPAPDTFGKSWDELTNEQQQAATLIGYTPELWDNKDLVTTTAATVEYEQVGWVFTALHSGQKAAEMILALKNWSDLFPVEDFGTFSGTLGLFQACSRKAQVKGQSNFHLLLKANADSCAKTKIFQLSNGASKIRIAFKFKVKNFEEGDFFSVEIATSDLYIYKQVLNVGKGPSGNSGISGYVEIPENNKWFIIGKQMNSNRKWFEVELKDFWIGSVERISLQIRSHTANKNNRKVMVDDVIVQELVKA
eukprot:CAMPEP_0194277800 /NCGR_PEP_ID=MMETSP0169-20130528/10013_1 /TAXON_ID=218684 /ORGANISM="Corethron pennatum, Strain L29A3" /LENGTH=812 /DNA_ID=CAMNT_0039021847 /DNA_START=29 /DNA_END=2467 /DNA_ORIENTATION=+